MRVLAFILFSTIFSQSFAKRFENNYIAFDLPVGWECTLEGTEYICQSTIEERKKEAIIIFAAKMRGEVDSLRHYQTYLKKRKKMRLASGDVIVSEPKSLKVNKINNHSWVDALHLSSEIPDYYTRYLATVKEDLGIAFTISIARPFYSTYSNLFNKMISSIRVYRKRGVKASSRKTPIKKKSFDIFTPDEEEAPSIAVDSGPKKVVKKSNKDNDDLILYGGIFLLLVMFVFFRRRS